MCEFDSYVHLTLHEIYSHSPHYGPFLFYFGDHLPNGSNPIDSFSGISMCILFSQISCRSIFMGLSARAIETLGSQHYGSQNYVEVGITLQRSLWILGLFTIPIMICWYCVEEIFLAIGVSASIWKVLKIFFRIRTLALPSDVIGNLPSKVCPINSCYFSFFENNVLS